MSKYHVTEPFDSHKTFKQPLKLRVSRVDRRSVCGGFLQTKAAPYMATAYVSNPKYCKVLPQRAAASAVLGHAGTYGFGPNPSQLVLGE